MPYLSFYVPEATGRAAAPSKYLRRLRGAVETAIDLVIDALLDALEDVCRSLRRRLANEGEIAP